MTELGCVKTDLSIKNGLISPTSQFPEAEPDPVVAAPPLIFLFAQVLLQYGWVLVPSKCFGRI